MSTVHSTSWRNYCLSKRIKARRPQHAKPSRIAATDSTPSVISKLMRQLGMK